MTAVSEPQVQFQLLKGHTHGKLLSRLILRDDLGTHARKAVIVLALHADTNLRANASALDYISLFSMGLGQWRQGCNELVAKGVVSRVRHFQENYTYTINDKA